LDVSSSSTTITINKGNPNLSWSEVSKYFLDPAFTVTSPVESASISGTYSYSSSSSLIVSISGSTFTIGDAGNATITATFTPADVSNYNTATISKVFTVVGGAPAAPRISSASAGTNSVTVNTIAATGSAGTSSMTVKVGSDSNTCTVNSSNGSCTVSGLTSGTSYAISVTATNKYGTSTPSSVVNITVGSASAPSAPNITEIRLTGKGSVSVSFQSASSPSATITDYEFSINGGSSWNSIGVVNSFSIDGLIDKTNYSVVLRAKNSNGTGGSTSGSWYQYYRQLSPFSPRIQGLNEMTNGSSQLLSTVGNAGAGRLEWSTSTPSLCTVDQRGSLISLRPGKCVASVRTKDDDDFFASESTSLEVIIRPNDADKKAEEERLLAEAKAKAEAEAKAKAKAAEEARLKAEAEAKAKAEAEAKAKAEAEAKAAEEARLKAEAESSKKKTESSVNSESKRELPVQPTKSIAKAKGSSSANVASPPRVQLAPTVKSQSVTLNVSNVKVGTKVRVTIRPRIKQ